MNKRILATLLLGLACPAWANSTISHDPRHRGGFSSRNQMVVSDSWELTQSSDLLRIAWWGGDGPDGSEEVVAPDDFVIRIFADHLGAPGELLQSYDAGPATREATGAWVNPPDDSGFPGVPEYRYSFEPPDALTLPSSSAYWISIVNRDPETGARREWIWEEAYGGTTLQRSGGDPVKGPWAAYTGAAAFELTLAPSDVH